MPPDPLITTVAELEPYGLTIKTLAILEGLDVVLLSDMETVTAKDIWSAPTGGKVAIKNIQETLRNYLARRIVRTDEQLMFPPDSKHRSRK